MKPANMRKAFKYPHKEATHYFPGHMDRGEARYLALALDYDTGYISKQEGIPVGCVPSAAVAV